MKTFVAIALAVICGCLVRVQLNPATAQENAPAPVQPRFVVVDVMVDTGAEALAAYQLEVSAPNQDMKIVGIEGGEPAAFRNAPYYDAAALQHKRVILGAFSTAAAGQLPRGSVRVASVHCLTSVASLVLNGKVTVAATEGGRPIKIQVNVKERNGK